MAGKNLHTIIVQIIEVEVAAVAEAAGAPVTGIVSDPACTAPAARALASFRSNHRPALSPSLPCILQLPPRQPSTAREPDLRGAALGLAGNLITRLLPCSDLDLTRLLQLSSFFRVIHLDLNYPSSSTLNYPTLRE